MAVGPFSFVEYLATQVENGYTIVTWNGLGFDFDILADESQMLAECRQLAIGHVQLPKAVCLPIYVRERFPQ